MPFEIPKSEVAALIPSTSSSKCEAFKRMLNFPSVLDGLISYMFDEGGNLSEQFSDDLCATGCAGGGGGGSNPSMPAPTGVNATDGAFSDKVQVSWNEVVPPEGISDVTAYKVYRALATETNPNNATLIATVAAPTLTYDDETAAPGTTYNYWVKAQNLSEVSAFSGSDVGSADAPSGDIDAVSDLRVSYGLGFSDIRLVWTPPAGATKYDVYRNTSATFGTATAIFEDISPEPTTQFNHTTSAPQFWENVGGELLLIYTDAEDPQTDYYFWIVAKKDSPPAVSLESNSGLGRIGAPAIYNQGNDLLTWSNLTHEIAADITKMRIVVTGSGGGGAGGNGNYGGGGAGGGATLFEEFVVTTGDDIELFVTGPTPDSGNAASTADGDDGAELVLQINTVEVMRMPGGHAGTFNPAGGGVGGLGDTATGDTAPTIYDGKPGEAAPGANGGRSGYSIFFRSMPMANPVGVYDGNGYVGSGSAAVSFNPTLAVGGSGLTGNVLLQFGE